MRFLVGAGLSLALSGGLGVSAGVARADEPGLVPLAPLPPAPASAAELPAALDAAQMRDDMHRYYTGEKRGGLWLLSIGAPSIAAGTGLLFHEGEFYRGLAYPLLVLGAAELIGGVAFYLNTNRRVPRFEKQLAIDPRAYRDSESARMLRVGRELRLLEGVEIAFIIAGATMTSIGALEKRDLLAGIGTGVMIQSAVLFIYDQLAARRAQRYGESLTRFGIGITPGTGATPSGAVVSMQRPL